MKTGLIGLPGSGVTSIFCLFCGRSYEAVAFSGKNEVNLGETKVPDSRVDELSRIFQPKKTVFASIDFADVPVEVDAGGALGSSTVNQIRSMDSLVVVIRSFTNPGVPHPNGTIDPLRDLRSILEEVLLADLLQVEKKLEKIAKEGRLKSREGQIFLELKNHLESSTPIREMGISDDVRKEISGYRFLTEKPLMVIVNADPGEEMPKAIVDFLESNKLAGLSLAGQFELELVDLCPEEQLEFLSDLGLEKGGRDRFIQMAYDKLELITFLTYGEDECRAWSLGRGSDAVEAAGKIHSDLARGFIRAEVIHYDDFMSCGCSVQGVKKAGKMRMEGKKYIVQDGDMLTILFNI